MVAVLTSTERLHPKIKKNTHVDFSFRKHQYIFAVLFHFTALLVEVAPRWWQGPLFHSQYRGCWISNTRSQGSNNDGIDLVFPRIQSIKGDKQVYVIMIVADALVPIWRICGISSRYDYKISHCTSYHMILSWFFKARKYKTRCFNAHIYLIFMCIQISLVVVLSSRWPGLDCVTD